MPRPPKFLATAAHQTAAAAPHLFVGTSGWAYPSWKPGFYPQDVPSRAFLHAYAARLNAVEVNYTFRTLPTHKQLQGWLDATPPGFRFSFKAPQRITHFARLRSCAEPLAAFLAAIEPTAASGKLGPLLFQLPPNFKADPERLTAFLQESTLLRGKHLKISFEFRHPSWFTDDTYAILRDADAALCVADTDDLQTPDITTANFRCYRLRQDGGYDDPSLTKITKTLLQGTASGEVYGFFRHQDEPTGALNAQAVLRRSVGQQAGA